MNKLEYSPPGGQQQQQINKQADTPATQFSDNQQHIVQSIDSPQFIGSSYYSSGNDFIYQGDQNSWRVPYPNQQTYQTNSEYNGQHPVLGSGVSNSDKNNGLLGQLVSQQNNKEAAATFYNHQQMLLQQNQIANGIKNPNQINNSNAFATNGGTMSYLPTVPGSPGFNPYGPQNVNNLNTDSYNKFGIAIELPSHLPATPQIPQTLRNNYQITCELKFFNPQTMTVLSNLTNIPLQPLLDLAKNELYSKQQFYTVFSTTSPTILIDVFLTLPWTQTKRKQIRGSINLAELAATQAQSYQQIQNNVHHDAASQPVNISIDLPEFSQQDYNVVNNSIFPDEENQTVAKVYLRFNLAMQQAQLNKFGSQVEICYTLSDLILQVEYQEASQLQSQLQNIQNSNLIPSIGQGPLANGPNGPFHPTALQDFKTFATSPHVGGSQQGRPSRHGSQDFGNFVTGLQVNGSSGPQAVAAGGIHAPPNQIQNPYQQIQGALTPQGGNLLQPPNQYRGGLNQYGQATNQQQYGQYGDYSHQNANYQAMATGSPQPAEHIQTPNGPYASGQAFGGGNFGNNYNIAAPGLPKQYLHPNMQQQNLIDNLENQFNQALNLQSTASPGVQQDIQKGLHQGTGTGQYLPQTPNSYQSGAPYNNSPPQYQTPSPPQTYPLNPTQINQGQFRQPAPQNQQFGTPQMRAPFGNFGNQMQGMPQQNPQLNQFGQYQQDMYGYNQQSHPGMPPPPTNFNSMMRPPPMTGGQYPLGNSPGLGQQFDQYGNPVRQFFQNQQTASPLNQWDQMNQSYIRPRGPTPPQMHQPNNFGQQPNNFQTPGISPNYQYPYPQQYPNNQAQTNNLSNLESLGGAIGQLNLQALQQILLAQSGSNPQNLSAQIELILNLTKAAQQNSDPSSLNTQNPGSPQANQSISVPSLQNQGHSSSKLTSNANSGIIGGTSPSPSQTPMNSGLQQQKNTAKANKQKLSAAQKQAIFLQKGSINSAQTMQMKSGFNSGAVDSSKGSSGSRQNNSQRLDKINVPFHSIIECDTQSSNTSTSSIEIPHLSDLAEYLCTQKGSRTMQDFLKKAPYNSINLIIEKIKDEFGRLMSDSYGNYFCQSLVRTVGAEQRLKILKSLSNQFVAVSCDTVGTHSMQRLVEIVCEEEEKLVIFNSIQDNIERLAFHHKGNYVLLTIIGVLKGSLLTEIINHLLPKFPQLMLDMLGICLVTKAIQFAYDPEQIQRIIFIISDHIVATIQSPYGNYAITEALDKWGFEICEPLVNKIKENFAQYAMQKYSSNVIEKCVERADIKIIDDFKNIILEGESQGKQIMKMLLRSQQSFFIVQKIYNRLKNEIDREAIAALLADNLQHAGEKIIKNKCLQIINKTQGASQHSMVMGSIGDNSSCRSASPNQDSNKKKKRRSSPPNDNQIVQIKPLKLSKLQKQAIFSKGASASQNLVKTNTSSLMIKDNQYHKESDSSDDAQQVSSFIKGQEESKEEETPGGEDEVDFLAKVELQAQQIQIQPQQTAQHYEHEQPQAEPTRAE